MAERGIHKMKVKERGKMKINNHNSLGHERPLSLVVKQSSHTGKETKQVHDESCA